MIGKDKKASSSFYAKKKDKKIRRQEGSSHCEIWREIKQTKKPRGYKQTKNIKVNTCEEQTEILLAIERASRLQPAERDG